MDHEQQYEVEEGVVVPPAAQLQVERGAGNGSVPDLDDDQLADPDELERQMWLELWRPVLDLPEPVAEQRDKRRAEEAAVRRRLKDARIQMQLVQRRLPRAAGRVLGYVRSGVLGVEHIVEEHTAAMARLHLRVVGLKEALRALREARGA